MLTSLAAILAVVVVGVPLLMFLLQERLIFFPQPLDAAQREAIGRQFSFAKQLFIQSESGERLQAWYVPGAPGKPLVLYFGGNAEEVSWMLPDARTRAPGIGWLLVSYRGYGGSEGSPSEAAIRADALRWHDYAVKELGATRVIAFGRSLGSGAAVFLASQRKLEAVVLVSPFDSLVEVARHHYPLLPVRAFLRHPFDSASRAPGIAAPLLCIAAARDEIIPAVHARRLYDAWGGPKRWLLLEEAGHNTTDSHPLFWTSVTDFLVNSHP
ncbi:MAG TPA: alpha/beta hydrolase [Burkholderiales bacterium]|nr:alpha/beta hydrolase [Burkholderiales bacterium]